MQQTTTPGSAPDSFTDQDLRDALADANLPTLLAALAHVTGEDRWIESPFVPTLPPDLGDHDSGGFAEDVQDRIRAEAFDVLRRLRDGEVEPAPQPDPDRLVRILSATLGEVLPEGYGHLLGEELGIYDRSSVPVSTVGEQSPLRVAIIGAGLSGLCLAIRLEQARIPYVVIEKNDDVGGTWHENFYPGCGVDTPSNLYSLSFALNPDWTRYFAGRDELAEYWRSLADRWDVRRNIVFSTEVVSAAYDEEQASWKIVTRAADGLEDELDADILVSAVGLLNRPSVPVIRGLDTFEGPCLHTARWDREIDITGKRVAVIGTGASAMQFVPAAAGVASEVRVFQRSPQWAMPHPNYRRDIPDGVAFLNRHVPNYQGWYRLRLFWRMGDKLHGLLQIDPEYPHPDRAINRGNDRLRKILTSHIESELEGRPDLLAKSLPSYPPYGKRLLIDNGWFRTIRRDDVDLVTENIETVTPRGVRTTDGTEYEADIIVLATGFDAVQVLGSVDIRGRDGTSLREVWGDDDGRAYLGITVPGFPNFFCLYGPNTNTGHGGTVVAGTEIQVQYVTSVLAEMIDEGLASIEVRQDTFDRYDDELGEALSRTIWTHPGMTTYYRNSRGRVVTNSPWQYIEYWRRAHQPNMDDFEVESALSPAARMDGRSA
ncbi:NAD(P)/FAD-dependent oxidoreductase [Rhodococcus sp. T2V]|uniref:flavin-containing monooxygenase n=1 Tax=Rhodococcus sp. T2V TaxID=3034164 RepID=UPI0023E2924D|nr:NAD(P)/FAD-dependent oxidoreductase [Rhodococcus sp. T2V]MDF3308322.1 NAD(P)/FAD-dependent oxidoreductase [Rhodococcus sp. T2V]